MKIDFRIGWLGGEAFGAGHGGELLRLLRTLRNHRSLREAAQAASVSYRFAWGLLAAAAREFGAPLVHMQRGRGAELTSLGAQLLELDDRIAARLQPVLARLEAEIQPRLAGLASARREGLSVYASHDLALASLREVAAARGVSLDLQFQGSEACLEALARRRCDVAGFHTSADAGDVGRPAFGPLRPERHRVVLFAVREQGLMVRPGARIKEISDLAKKGVRFINRQKGSGTRELVDTLLAREHLAPASIQGYENEEFTHLAVAATVSAGHADAGFGIRAAAAEYKLAFIPVATERYYLACSRDTYDAAPFQKLLALLASRAFRSRAASLPGYDLAGSGTPIEFASAARKLG